MASLKQIKGNGTKKILNGGSSHELILGFGVTQLQDPESIQDSDQDFAETLYGASGNDVLYGGGGNDTLYGDSGNDILNGDQGDDSLSGGSGDDTLNGGAGNDIINGGGGSDTYLSTATLNQLSFS